MTWAMGLSRYGMKTRLRRGNKVQCVRMTMRKTHGSRLGCVMTKMEYSKELSINK